MSPFIKSLGEFVSTTTEQIKMLKESPFAIPIRQQRIPCRNLKCVLYNSN